MHIYFGEAAAAEIYTLSLHDALPICPDAPRRPSARRESRHRSAPRASARCLRSEEHTSELQSHVNLVCRLLLEKKKVDRPADTDTTGLCSAYLPGLGVGLSRSLHAVA